MLGLDKTCLGLARFYGLGLQEIILDMKIYFNVLRFNNYIQLVSVWFFLSTKAIPSMGQMPDSTKNIIQTILLDKEVSEKIFFYYQGEWIGEGVLSSGNYAFICPDTTFQKMHPGILNEFPYTDNPIYKVKFYNDSTKAIYINGVIGFELFIVFKEISINAQTAKISFFTTSRINQKRFKKKYVNVT